MDWQIYPKPAASIHCGLNPECTAMLSDNGLHHSQTQAGAAFSCTSSEKRLKQTPEGFLRHATAGIGNDETGGLDFAP
jgi:hypothetical protein